MAGPQSYTRTFSLTHWLLAVFMLGMLASGWYMHDIAVPPFKFQLYGIHKATGMLVLAVALYFWYLRATTRQPHLVPGPKWQTTLAKAVHLSLYVAILAMPVSGYVMSAAGGHAISMYGLFNVPLVPVPKVVGGAAHTVHGIVGDALWYLVALHVAGALYHHLIKKDATLRRMLP